MLQRNKQNRELRKPGRSRMKETYNRLNAMSWRLAALLAAMLPGWLAVRLCF